MSVDAEFPCYDCGLRFKSHGQLANHQNTLCVADGPDQKLVGVNDGGQEFHKGLFWSLKFRYSLLLNLMFIYGYLALSNMYIESKLR